MKKLLAVCLMFCLFLTVYLQAQNFDFTKRRKATFAHPSLNANIATGSQNLACGNWEACRKNSKIRSNIFINLGLDIFLSNPYWSIPINIFNAKSNSHRIETLSSENLVLETLEIATGIRRHHLMRSGKYNVVDYYYGLGLMLVNTYHYSGNFQFGFSRLQNVLCQNAVYCAKGSGPGYYIDLGIQYSIKAKVTIGMRFKRSTATHTLTNQNNNTQESIKINAGGTSISLIAGWNF